MADEKKNHHFVPRSFLKGFAIDSEASFVWGYDKKYGKCAGKRPISRICSLDYYYEQPLPDGTKSQCLEDALQTIETPSIDIIRNLSTSRTLSLEDKGHLSLYIGLLLTRGPSFRDGVHEFRRHVVEIMSQRAYESGRLPEPPEVLKRLIVNNDITSVIKTEILPHASLGHMRQLAIDIGKSLCSKKWDIYYVDGSDCFVTSDTPVMFGPCEPTVNRAIGPAHPESFVLCPITRKVLVAARPHCESDSGPLEFMPAKTGMVEKTNELMCFNAQRFVYASQQSPELLGHVRKTKGYCRRFKTYRIGDSIVSRWDTLPPPPET
jgi:hypothetical protein